MAVILVFSAIETLAVLLWIIPIEKGSSYDQFALYTLMPLLFLTVPLAMASISVVKWKQKSVVVSCLMLIGLALNAAGFIFYIAMSGGGL